MCSAQGRWVCQSCGELSTGTKLELGAASCQSLSQPSTVPARTPSATLSTVLSPAGLQSWQTQTQMRRWRSGVPTGQRCSPTQRQQATPAAAAQGRAAPRRRRRCQLPPAPRRRSRRHVSLSACVTAAPVAAQHSRSAATATAMPEVQLDQARRAPAPAPTAAPALLRLLRPPSAWQARMRRRAGTTAWERWIDEAGDSQFCRLPYAT